MAPAKTPVGAADAHASFGRHQSTRAPARAMSDRRPAAQHASSRHRSPSTTCDRRPAQRPRQDLQPDLATDLRAGRAGHCGRNGHLHPHGTSQAGSPERREQLEDIDPSWRPARQVTWQRCFHLTRQHLEVSGALPTGPGGLLDQGEDLRRWVRSVRLAGSTLHAYALPKTSMPSTLDVNLTTPRGGLTLSRLKGWSNARCLVA